MSLLSKRIPMVLECWRKFDYGLRNAEGTPVGDNMVPLELAKLDALQGISRDLRGIAGSLKEIAQELPRQRL